MVHMTYSIIMYSLKHIIFLYILNNSKTRIEFYVKQIYVKIVQLLIQ